MGDQMERYNITLQMQLIYSIEAKDEGQAVTKAREMLMQTGDYNNNITFIVQRAPPVPPEDVTKK